MKRMSAVVAVLCAALVGCTQRPAEVSPVTAKEFTERLTYAKDSRTDLCYALLASRHVLEPDQSGLTVTYVPCTPEVEKLIVK